MKKIRKEFNKKFGLASFKYIGGIKHKLCSRCGEYKKMDIEFFSISSSNNCGFRSECRECINKHKNINDHFKSNNINENGSLLCKRCKKYKDKSLFYDSKKFEYRNNKDVECKDCYSQRKKNSRLSAKINQDLYIHLGIILKGCRSRAKKNLLKWKFNNSNFDLNIEYLLELFYKQNGKCIISGIDMTYNVGHGKQNYNISVDRIDCSRGYTKENVQLICSHINMMRSNLDISELIDICNTIVIHNKNKNNKEIICN